ncbi:MAG TPA: hypothetical protein VF587_15305, partial [Solirubrobacteraceae bacterium]
MTSTRRALCLVTAATALALPAGSASAAVTCSYSAAQKKASVTATTTSPAAKVRRGFGGDAIVVNDMPCGEATVQNTDTIAYVDMTNDLGTSLEVSLNSGPLAPGASSEVLGDEEIEITAAFGGGEDELRVAGAETPDHLRLGTMNDGRLGVDFDGGATTLDVDLEASGVDVLHVVGHQGDDDIRANGGANFAAPVAMGLAIEGEQGDDVLRGGDGSDTVSGGSGFDTLRGGKGDDTLLPAEADDEVEGGLGQDEISYADTSQGVTLDLGEPAPQDTGGAGTETVGGVEDVT